MDIRKILGEKGPDMSDETADILSVVATVGAFLCIVAFIGAIGFSIHDNWDDIMDSFLGPVFGLVVIAAEFLIKYWYIPVIYYVVSKTGNFIERMDRMALDIEEIKEVVKPRSQLDDI